MSKPNRPKDAAPSFLTGEQRINKLLAAAGFGSRRQVDELITEGRVEIDGKIVNQVGIKVNADESKILVDGEPLKRHKPVYYAVHKPAGVLCTNADPEGRPRVIELVPSTARLFPVGRLDSSSTGLILLTNDGELAQRLAHPKHCVPKTYFVVVAGQVEKEAMQRLQRGIYLAEGIARVDGAKIRKVRQGCTEIDITLSEGKNREIRRVLARLGHKVVVLRRTAIGPLKLGDMPEGSYRPLTSSEVAALYQAVEDIKRARNLDRRERKKRADEHAAKLAGAPVSKGPKSSQPKTAIYNEDADWDEDNAFSDASYNPESSDSLPPISQNPYSTEDDADDASESFKDSVLVSDYNSDEVFSNRRGAVISYEDEFEGGPEGDDFDDFENSLGDDGDEELEENSGESAPNRGNDRRGGDNRGRGNRGGDRGGDRGGRPERSFARGPRENGPRGGDRRQGGFGGQRREGGFSGQRREGGFGGQRREGGSGGERREGGFSGQRREGGFGGQRREGGFSGQRREGGFSGQRREGGFGGQRREGGSGGERREGGFGGQRRESGFGGQRREGGFGGERREGGFSGQRREGGFGGQRREGGFGGERREGGFGGQRREGGFGGQRREGGFSGGNREGGSDRRPRSGGPREGRIEGGRPSGGRPGFGRPSGGRRPTGGPGFGGRRGGPGGSGGGRGRPSR